MPSAEFLIANHSFYWGITFSLIFSFVLGFEEEEEEEEEEDEKEEHN